MSDKEDSNPILKWLPLESPLFLAVGGFIALTVVMLRSSAPMSGEQPLVVVGFVVCAAVLAVVAVKWATAGRGSVRDWMNGGVASIVLDDTRRVAWSDWAILVSRVGSFDIRRQRLRLEKRFVLGLILWESVDRTLSPSDRVYAVHSYNLECETSTTRERYKKGLWSTYYNHRVEVHSSDAPPLWLFDLTSFPREGEAAALVDRLCARIESARRGAPLGK